MRNIVKILFCLLLYGGQQALVHADSVPHADFNQDAASIKNMTGCFEVSYQNAETFAVSKDYAYHDRFKTAGMEWIFVDKETAKELSLQHLLIIPGGGGVIKHWRQQWSFENSALWQFIADNKWDLKELSADQVAGQWTQKVYQVDDSPRYECSAPWIHWGQKNYWECQADAPLPRREFTKRSDYNLLRRTNRHEITATGHLHSEDNIKIVKKGDLETPLVLEKGMNNYKRVASEQCSSAVSWWGVHKKFWNDVQSVWQEIYQGQRNYLQFAEQKEGHPLWEKLFELDEKLSGQADYSTEKTQSEARKIIQDYLL